MPIPPLPLEVVGLIVEQVRLDCGGNDKQKRSNGVNIALVCRSWRDLGTSVVWHLLVLDSAARARRAHEHLTRSPHLVRHVQLLAVVWPESADAHMSEEASIAAWEETGLQVEWILSACTNLKHLDLKTDWVAPLPLLAAAKHLLALRILQVELPRPVGAPAFLHCLQQFRPAQSMYFWCRFLPTPFLPLSTPPSALSLSHLYLAVLDNSPAGRPFTSSLLQSLDPSALRSLELLLRDDHDVLPHLPRFNNLEIFSCSFPTTLPWDALFHRTLDTLRGLPSLTYIFLRSSPSGALHNLRSPHFPNLLTLLDTFPKAGSTVLDGFYFSPDESDPFLPPRPLKGKLVNFVRLLDGPRGGTFIGYALVEMKDGKQVWYSE